MSPDMILCFFRKARKDSQSIAVFKRSFALKINKFDDHGSGWCYQRKQNCTFSARNGDEIYFVGGQRGMSLFCVEIVFKFQLRSVLEADQLRLSH